MSDSTSNSVKQQYNSIMRRKQRNEDALQKAQSIYHENMMKLVEELQDLQRSCTHPRAIGIRGNNCRNILIQGYCPDCGLHAEAAKRN